MRSVEITRAGDRAVADQLTEMRRWLDREGIRVSLLQAVRILKGRAAHTILGNHEEGFLGPQGIRARQPDWIDRSLLAWLAEQPKRLELSIGGKKLMFT